MKDEVHEDDDEASQLQKISKIWSGKKSTEEGSTQATKKSTKGPLDAMFYKKSELTLGKWNKNKHNWLSW